MSDHHDFSTDEPEATAPPPPIVIVQQPGRAWSSVVLPPALILLAALAILSYQVRPSPNDFLPRFEDESPRAKVEAHPKPKLHFGEVHLQTKTDLEPEPSSHREPDPAAPLRDEVRRASVEPALKPSDARAERRNPFEIPDSDPEQLASIEPRLGAPGPAPRQNSTPKFARPLDPEPEPEPEPIPDASDPLEPRLPRANVIRAVPPLGPLPQGPRPQGPRPQGPFVQGPARAAAPAPVPDPAEEARAKANAERRKALAYAQARYAVEVDRIEFLGDLRRVLHNETPDAAREIANLMAMYGRSTLPEVEADVNRARGSRAFAELSLEQRVGHYRQFGLPEPRVLDDLARIYAKAIGSRRGPRSQEEALVLAARRLVNIPFQPPAPTLPASAALDRR